MSKQRAKGTLVTETWRQRLWQRVETGWEDECWTFQGYCHPTRGYGQMSKVGRALAETHRLSYEYWFGPIPTGMCICHTCDNPPCVNPNHLFLGSHADNMRDKAAKGRGSGAIGSANHNCRLTKEQVDRIRQRVAYGETRAQVALDFGVTPQYVGQLVNGYWRRHGQ